MELAVTRGVRAGTSSAFAPFIAIALRGTMS